MKIRNFSAAILLWTFHPLAYSETLTIEKMLTHVWQNSPQIAGQKIQTDLAVGDQSRRFVLNEPQLLYSNSDDNSAQSYGLSLLIPFPGKSFAFMKLDRARAEAQKAELRAKKYDLAKLYVQAFLDCAAAQASYEIQKLTTADLETVAKTLNSLYETGHSTQAEKIGSELQFRQSKFDLTNADDKQNLNCKKLDALLPADLSTDHELTSLLPDDLDNSLLAELGGETADQNRSRTAIALAQANNSTAVWSQLPDLNLSAVRNQYLYLPASPSGKSWTTTFGISVVLPLWFPFRENIEMKRTTSQASIDENLALIQRTAANSDQEDAAKEYSRSRMRLEELRRKDLSLAEALIESTYSAYRSGKLGYAELVLSRKTLSDIRNQEIQLKVSIVSSHLRCLNLCEIKNSSPVTDEKKL